MIWAASRRGEKCLVCFCEHTSFAYSMNRIKDSVMSCSLPHEYAASNVLLALRVHSGPGCTAVFSLLLAPYPGFSLHLWPLQNKPLLICLKVLKATGNGEEKINRQSTKTAEERDKTTLGQRRKEMKLGICPVCAWLDLCSRFIYFIEEKRAAGVEDMWICKELWSWILQAKKNGTGLNIALKTG